jgi:hypothetical protein
MLSWEDPSYLVRTLYASVVQMCKVLAKVNEEMKNQHSAGKYVHAKASHVIATFSLIQETHSEHYEGPKAERCE